LGRSASPPKSAPDKATSLRLLLGAPFGLKAEVLNQQGRLIKFKVAFHLMLTKPIKLADISKINNSKVKIQYKYANANRR
jgi:hypothetical protein